MAELNVKIIFNDGDLEKSIKFIHGNSEHTPMIIRDYFSGNVEIDMNKVEDKDERYYHMNGITALLITLINAQSKENVTA